MKMNTYPIVFCKKINDTVFTKEGEKRHEVKTIQYILPKIDFKSVIKALNVLTLILLLIAIITGKIKEAAPIMTFILEQLR